MKRKILKKENEEINASKIVERSWKAMSKKRITKNDRNKELKWLKKL